MMDKKTDVNATEIELHPAFARPLEALARLREVFLHDFPESADPRNVKEVCATVRESMNQLCLEWESMRAFNGFGASSAAEKVAWARGIIAELDKYLSVRVQGKYYLPEWELVYHRRFDYVQGLEKNQGHVLFSSGLGERCCEIASVAGYGYCLNGRGRAVRSQGLLMECIQSRIVVELEQGVRNALVCHADREDQIVVLLQVLVEAAEHGLLSLFDMERMRGFIKIQIDMRPSYKGVDLTEGHSYIQAINRQNALLKAALPFFG